MKDTITEAPEYFKNLDPNRISQLNGMYTEAGERGCCIGAHLFYVFEGRPGTVGPDWFERVADNAVMPEFVKGAKAYANKLDMNLSELEERLRKHGAPYALFGTDNWKKAPHKVLRDMEQELLQERANA